MLAVRPTVRGRNCSSSPILPYAFYSKPRFKTT